MTTQTLYLAKADNTGICHCECEEAIISWPGQMDCPWCGCGWLFTCMKCRKAFTFAQPVRLDMSLEELARMECEQTDSTREPDEEMIGDIVEMMSGLLSAIEDEEDTFVYFDGYLIPTFYDELFSSGQESPLEVQGLHRDHMLSEVPQLRFRDDPTQAEASWLADEGYWGPPREDE